MKPFTKKALLFAGIFFALGMVCCTAGWILGYVPGQFWETARTVRAPQTGNKTEKQTTAREAVYPDVSSIRVSVGAAACDILSYSGDTVRIEASDEAMLDCKQNGSELDISFGYEEHKVWNWFTETGNTGESICIYVPEKQSLKELYVDVGAADFAAEGITCRDLEVSCGAGRVAFSGKITGDCIVECGAGSIELVLENRERDFDYALSCGLGNIEIQDGPGIAGIGEYTKENGSGRKMELECGLGNIQVAFSDRSF